ncbi:MAG: hypothetical protein ACLPWS_04730 [Rhodomicrobium sp.]
MFKALSGLKIIAGFVVISAVAGTSSQAPAASLAVELACATDYFAYCSKHDPDSPEVRVCMRVNGRKLSQRCLRALVAAGEVSKEEVERRTASGR